ncbi:hypothetical protein SNE40_005126 [Patella caerulea]|uniref:Uncharacterized protein n=1 Tax=Patella caerulea TaxID=87958 RepID=A0AAN8Q6I3_PATCE
MNNDRPFYLTLPSDSSMSWYPDNKVSTYHTHLDPPLLVDHREWEVGLSMITLPDQWQNIDHRDNTIGLRIHPWSPPSDEPEVKICQDFYSAHKIDPSHCFKGVKGDEIKGSIEMETHIKSGDYESLRHILDVLNKHLKVLWYLPPIYNHLAHKPVRLDPNNKEMTDHEKKEQDEYETREAMRQAAAQKGSFVSFKKDGTNDKVYLKINHVQALLYFDVLPKIELRLCGPIVSMLGWPGNELLVALQSIDMTGDDGQTLRYFYAHHTPNLQIQYDLFYIYTDIIEPQTVGDVKATLLDVIPSRRLYHRPARIHYLPLKYSRLSSIGLYIRNGMGKAVPFLDGKVVTQLHFRRR